MLTQKKIKYLGGWREGRFGDIFRYCFYYWFIHTLKIGFKGQREKLNKESGGKMAERNGQRGCLNVDNTCQKWWRERRSRTRVQEWEKEGWRWTLNLVGSSWTGMRRREKMTVSHAGFTSEARWEECLHYIHGDPHTCACTHTHMLDVNLTGHKHMLIITHSPT